MEQSKGFEEGGADYVWKLQKILYGTMQGIHDWIENLDKTFEGHRYYKLRTDPQIQSKVHNDKLTLTSTWTNDVLGASSTLEGEYLAKLQLGLSYEIKDLEEAKFILRIRINRNMDGDITLSQQAYCECLLNYFNMISCLPTMTPLSPSIVLSSEDCPTTPDEENSLSQSFRLTYVVTSCNKTRFDIFCQYACLLCSQPRNSTLEWIETCPDIHQRY